MKTYQQNDKGKSVVDSKDLYIEGLAEANIGTRRNQVWRSCIWVMKPRLDVYTRGLNTKDGLKLIMHK